MHRHILIVDDDRQMVRTLCDILRLRGWAADGVHSGEEAVEAVRRQPYATVLMDVKMGGMNGVEALAEMKKMRPALRVVLMTAYTADELLAEATREGALRILAKPVAVPGLITMLEESVKETQRVLVVDDDPGYLRTLAAILRDGGYIVFEAVDLGDALDKLKGGAPAAVVLDLRLDNAAPRDSVVAIRAVSPAVCLILYSGSSGAIEETTATVPSSWVYATLRKPFPPERLVELLNEIRVA
jgi:two-component system response regulator HydG